MAASGMEYVFFIGHYEISLQYRMVISHTHSFRNLAGVKIPKQTHPYVFLNYFFSGLKRNCHEASFFQDAVPH
jgi:hypothetical protein